MKKWNRPSLVIYCAQYVEKTVTAIARSLTCERRHFK